MLKHILFDWGDTLMVDHPHYSGPMVHWPTVELCKGAAEALDELSSRYSCHVATNAEESSEEDIQLAFKRCHIDQYISRYFCFRSLGARKPEGAYFKAIQQALDCNTDDILMVGDSYEKDIVGANACGIEAVWVNPEAKSEPETQSAKWHTIRDLTELCALLNRIY